MAGIKGASWRAKTHCKRGHPLFGDNIRIDRGGYRVCKECHLLHNREYKRKERAAGLMFGGYRKTVINIVGPERLKDAFEVARETGRMSAVYVAVGSHEKWKCIRHYYPKIAKVMSKKIVEGRLAIKRLPRIVHVSESVLDVISAAVPRHLPRDLRDDAIQNIWVAVQEGRVKRNEIAARANEFVRAEYRLNHNAWGPRSLDVPIYLDSGTTLIETITHGLWD
jgi:hypothetical protein